MAQEAVNSADLASLAKLTTPALLSEKVAQLRRARQRQETEWKLNLAFYNGDQYVYYNRVADRIDRVPIEDGEKPRYRVRLISNQIQPGVEQRIAKLTKTKPIYSATPASGSDADFKAAQMAERLLEYWWEEFDLNPKRDDVLRHASTSQGYWKITWDPHASKSMRFTLDPQGQPITNEKLETMYRAQLESMGLAPFEKVVYMGDIRVEVMGGEDVIVDTAGVKSFEDAKVAFCRHYMTPDEIKARWGVEVKADAIPTDEAVSLPINKEERPTPSVKAVWVGYMVPHPALPDGRYVIWTDGVDKPLEDGPWRKYFPEGLDCLPLVKFPGIPTPGSVYDTPPVSGVRSLQKEFNRTASQILEFKNLTVRPQWRSPVGSLRQRITTEPGAVWEFVPNNGFAPEPIPPGQLPNYVFETLQDLAGRIKEHFGLMDFSEGGQVPSHMDSGIAVDLMQEMATDRLAPTVLLIEKALSRAGKIMLQLAQAYYTEERQLKIKGAGGAVHVQKFSKADLASGVDVTVEAGSGLPRTRAGRQDRILKLAELQLITQQTALKHLDVADLEGVMAQIRADEEQASRENDKMLKGIPLNPLAVQNAMVAVAQGINPETGEALGSPEEAQQVLLRASVQPGPLDNHEQHIETHGLLIKSLEFESLPPQLQQLFIMHAQQHVAASQQPPMPVDPRISLAISSTMGPSGTAKLLERAGVDVTPEEAAEPPLETSVYDSMDKPDMDSAGNDQLDAEDRSQQMTLAAMKAVADERRAQENHELGMAAKRQSMDLARRKAAQSARQGGSRSG